jgi:hypothetical protein
MHRNSRYSPANGRGTLRRSQPVGSAASPLTQAVIGQVAYHKAARILPKNSYIPVCPIIAKNTIFEARGFSLKSNQQKGCALNHRAGSVGALGDSTNGVYN